MENFRKILDVYDIPPEIRNQYNKSDLNDHFKKLKRPTKENPDQVNRQSSLIIRYAEIIAFHLLEHVQHCHEIHKLYLDYLNRSLRGLSSTKRGITEIKENRI